jgi:hypothetical protein
MTRTSFKVSAGVPTAHPSRPVIWSFAPKSAEPGSMVTISGNGFSLVTSVEFGGIKAKFYNDLSFLRVVARVPLAARSGRIAVITSAGVGKSHARFVVR